MRRQSLFLRLVGLAVIVPVMSGCAVGNLREANQRLKESNDRLISENNRLEHELASVQASSARGVATPVPSTAPATMLDPAPTPTDNGLFPTVDGMTSVEESPIGVHYRFADRVFFSLGQAKLSTEGRRILGNMARLLETKYAGKMIRVEGHTDDTPIRKVRHLYPSNWELSTARACTVVRFLVEKGRLDAKRVYPAGFGYQRPAGSSKSKNRRVEITILNESI